MTIPRRLSLLVIFSLALLIVLVGLQARTAHAQQIIPLGSCGDTVSDDAQLFGGQIADVLNQAKTLNSSLQADTRVVTVTQSKLAGMSLKSYSDYIQTQCPGWVSVHSVILILAKGQEPFLHLGTAFSGKMTSADFQQMTLSVSAEANSGNYAQAAVDLLKQVQKKLSPDYTGLIIGVVVIVVVVAGIVLTIVLLRRRQRVANAKMAREQVVQAKQAAVNAIGPLSGKIDELAPRMNVLLALVPPATAAQLQNLFENAKQRIGRVQEELGNLLGNPDTNPGSATLRPEQYGQIQQSYQRVYGEAQEPLSLLNAVEVSVQRLESNPHERIDFQQLLAQGYAQRGQPMLPPGGAEQSNWQGR